MPHLGASTPESEENCAVMAARQLQDYLVNGNIRNSVNLPNLEQEWSGISRLCLIHKNVPAMLTNIMSTLSNDGINVENMTNKSKKDYAYTIVDVNTRITDAGGRRAARHPRRDPGAGAEPLICRPIRFSCPPAPAGGHFFCQKFLSKLPEKAHILNSERDGKGGGHHVVQEKIF